MAGNIYEFTGVVEKILPLQTFASGFAKRDLVLTDLPGAGGKFPTHLPFTFKRDNIALLDNLREGATVRIRFALDGRAWTAKDGTEKYFVDLTALGLEPAGDSAAPEAALPPPPADDVVGEEDIPF
jgi:hypothetical protein